MNNCVKNGITAEHDLFVFKIKSPPVSTGGLFKKGNLFLVLHDLHYFSSVVRSNFHVINTVRQVADVQLYA